MLPTINNAYIDSNTEDLYNRCVNRIIWGNDYGLPECVDNIMNTGFAEYEFKPEELNDEKFNKGFATIRPEKVSLIDIDVTKLP